MHIHIENLSKTYPNGNKALRGINLDISNGMFGLLGPNGAGKTTLMSILVTLLKQTAGKVNIGGFDLEENRKEIRAILGYLPQELEVFPKLKTGEVLDYCARLSGLRNKAARKKAVDEMLEKVRLSDERSRSANDLSGGMKRRIGIAQALIGKPKILIVDEPTTGLDPEERLRFRNILSDLSNEDIIIILSTHIVGDISSSCANMALLDRGEVVFQGPPENLIEQARGHTWLIEAGRKELDSIKADYPVVTSVPVDTGWEVQVVADRLDGFSGRPIEPNLEHAYVYFMEKVNLPTIP
jgi:ABC-2 type transport system ATP-binding protein